MNLSPGVRVGPYEILAPLGAGGMGEVYRARDERLARDIALKILSTDLSESGDHLRRFEQEARAASALNHPNIITIYDIGRIDSMAYIAMELIEGRDLRSMIAGTPLPLKQTMRIGVKVADGLAAAHERGIVHRDLKPENLMISRDGFVKILDFGLAKLVRPFTDKDTTLPHTTPGAVFGTVGYMSPEQAAARDIDFRSDQFALGVILYEMLTGRAPFAEPTAAETLASIIRNEPPPVASYNDSVPPELLRIVMRLLAKDPQDRYASTRDLARDLREVRDRISNSSDPERHSGVRTVPVPRARAAVLAVVALIVFGAGAAWMMRERPVEPIVAAARMKKPGAIAIVPFRDLSGSPEGQILTDGVSATISARLAEASGIRVTAPVPGNDAAADADPGEVARRTGADLVLHGGVQRAGDQLRVSFTLTDPASGWDVGADTLTGTTTDLFTLQDRVADRVMEKLNLRSKTVLPSSRAGLTSAADQQAFVEASGLLWRLRDDSAVELAITKLDSLLRNARDSAQVNGLLGRAHLLRYRRQLRPADLEQAKLFAERAVVLDDDLADAHVTLGQVHSNTGRHADAEREFRRALELQPNVVEAVAGLADALALMGRGSDAEAQYLRAAELAPDWPSAFSKLGGFYYNRGDYDQAIRNWQRQAELLPDSPRPYANLGAAYQAKGSYEQALSVYERSLSIRPSAAAYINRGVCEYLLGRYDDAVVSFARSAEMTPDDPICWMNLGDARRWSSKSKAQAGEAYARAISTAAVVAAANPKDPMPRVVAAVAHAKSGKAAQAKKAIDDALRIDPTNAVALYQAAVIAELRGDRDSALAWLNRAVSSGYPAADVARDPELSKLRDDPGYEKTRRER
ncbi:MAG TPA: protein kinase [Thermoanaerobaculia bacterium]|nr:protein kinase [Thermoanaerobaculia bacterium]